MKRFAITSIFTILLSICGYAQNFTLERVIAIAQDSTITAYQSKNALLRSEWEYKRFMATRKPQISFELNPGYQKFTSEPNLHYYKLRNYNMLNTFGEIRLEQQAVDLGGSFYASTGMIWTEYFGQNPDPRVFSSVPIGVGYYNNLISYNQHKWDKAIQDFHVESEKKAYRYELSSIAEQAENYFIDCLVAESTYKVCLTNSEVTKTALEIGKEKFALASITKNELFSLQLQFLNAENSVFDARQNRESARAALFSYLRMEDNGEELIIPDTPDYKYVDPQEAIQLAKENNPDYRNKREDILKAQQYSAKTRAEAAFLQTALDINVGIQNNAGTFAQSYSNQKFYAFGGITLKIPIFDGGLAKSKKKVAEYNLKFAESVMDEKDRQLELDVEVALKEFNTQQNLIDRTGKAIALADESFALARELYENGEIDINTFTLALTRKDEAYKNYLKSLKAYWDSWYALNKLCVTLQ